MNRFSESIQFVRADCYSFFDVFERRNSAGWPLDVEDCWFLERALRRMCCLTEYIPDPVFVRNFPKRQAVQISPKSWGMRLVSYPALHRAANNCYPIIQQMKVWKRFFSQQGYSSPLGRYLAAVVYHGSNCSSIPNTIEAHSFLNGMCSILGIDDAPETLDLAVSSVFTGKDVGAFEISMISEKCGLYNEVMKGKQVSFPIEDTFRGSIQKLRFSSFLLAGNSDYLDTDIMELYALISSAFYEVRSSILSSVNSHLRQKRSSVPNYEKMIQENPFLMKICNKSQEISITTNAIFRSREQAASATFLSALFSFLSTQNPPRSGCIFRLEIVRKKANCDNDNIPYDMVFDVLSKFFHLSSNAPIVVRYDANATWNTCLNLLPCS